MNNLLDDSLLLVVRWMDDFCDVYLFLVVRCMDDLLEDIYF
jgi:hypothetical protein